MTKANTTPAGKASQTGAKAADTSKAGAAASPQSTAGTRGTHQVADGHQISVKGKVQTAGYRVTAADFANKADPDGKKGLQRLVDGGELVKASGKASDGERAGGGVIDEGGATGAAPSGAQIIAAETGNDPEAAKVVDAALAGSESDLTAAADPDGAAKD